jgi:transaldolase
MSKLHQIHELGQSTWLHYMRRAFFQSGEFRQGIQDGIQGITADANTLAQTIANHHDYDEAIHQQVRAGTPYREIHKALMLDDVQRAADFLHPIFEESNGLNGFASLELDPALAHDAVATTATAKHILAGIDRGNVMVEIPATLAGGEAIRSLTADGVSLNATHILSISAFERVAQEYIAGLELYFDRHSVWRIAPTAVASFSVSAIDGAIDPLLQEKGLPELTGKTSLALAHLLCERYRQIFSGPRWNKLVRKGARPMRPKWTRLTPKSPDLPRLLYAESLIGPDTVLTFGPNTLAKFLADGAVAQTLPGDIPAARAHIEQLYNAGIDVSALLDTLHTERLAASVAQYETLIRSVTDKLYAVGQ